MTRYPKSQCEAHKDITTSEPVCVACLIEEVERLRNLYNGWQNFRDEIMLEQCVDHKHCFCVPVLRLELLKTTVALRSLLAHVTMIGIAEGFPIEVMYDETSPSVPQGFNIKAALIEAEAALGNDDAELRSYFPNLFEKKP